MKLIIDTNIIFSALIKEGKSAELIFDEQFLLFAPDFFLEEWTKYKDYILKKTSRDFVKFNNVLNNFMQVITIIPKEKYKEYMDKANKISPDRDDADFFALALELNCPIWSNDKVLKKQDVVKIYSTKELIEMF